MSTEVGRAKKQPGCVAVLIRVKYHLVIETELARFYRAN